MFSANWWIHKLYSNVNFKKIIIVLRNGVISIACSHVVGRNTYDFTRLTKCGVTQNY